jgi:hypothetical protein
MVCKMLKNIEGAERDFAEGTKGEDRLRGCFEGLRYKCSNYIISGPIEAASLGGD